jgi:hypothetical protein
MKHVILGLAAAVSIAAPAIAHHSFADYDDKRRMTLSGTIKSVRFTNPHIGLVVAVKTKTGTEDWEFSGPSPADWRAGGWVKSDFVPGEAVTITGFPKRDGTKHLSINLLKTRGKNWGKEYK